MTSPCMCSNILQVRAKRGPAPAPRQGFTLTELLAVLGIVLIVVVGTLSVWLSLAGSVGPGRAAAVVQAMLNGARDYAATNDVNTRVVFTNDVANAESGTRMSLQYDKDPDPDVWTWADVPARGAEQAGRYLFVLKNIPSLPNAPARPSDLADVDAAAVQAWQAYRTGVCNALASHGFSNTTGGYLGADAAFASGQTPFYVTFAPTGTLATGLPSGQTNPLALVIIQLAGRRVGEYEFYVLNVNTGARLVFE